MTKSQILSALKSLNSPSFFAYINLRYHSPSKIKITKKAFLEIVDQAFPNELLNCYVYENSIIVSLDNLT